MTNALRLVVPSRPPVLALVGVAIAVAGLGLDVVVHLTAISHEHHAGFSLSEHGAHLIGLIGMVIALAGVVLSGARRGRRPSSHSPERS
jgi:hypothetical protein